MKLLIIDDADAVRPRLAVALGEIEGIEVSSLAPRSGGILALVAGSVPDVVVIDICMLGGALDLIRSIKAIAHAPVVIALSSTSSIQYRAACHSAGAEYFFDKDRDQELLREAVAELRKELGR